MTAQQHTRDLDNFRDALSELRTGGGISEEFAQWHGQSRRLILQAVTKFRL